MLIKKRITLISILLFSSMAYSANDYVVGQLKPDKSVVIRSEVTGVVDFYSHDNGDIVKIGQELLSISSEDYALNLELAKYELDISKAELNIQEKQLIRYESLLKSKGVSVSDVDSQVRTTNISKSQVNVSKTQYKIAKNTLDKSTPEVPFDGVIIKRSVEVGQFISVGDSLYTIASLEKLKVKFYLLESDFNKFSKGELVNIYIPSKNEKLKGNVSLLSPALNDGDPGYLVEVTVDNSAGLLNAGMESYVYFNDEDIIK